MQDRITLASCALFGFRPDRDTSRYYRLLLNDLAAKMGDARLVVATNEPSGFDSKIEIEEVKDIEPWRKRLWPLEDWQNEYAIRIGWHPKNQALGQAMYPSLPGVYLAKTALMLDMAKRYERIVWLDAGLLFSVLHDHGVPEKWSGYDAGLLQQKLYPMIHRKAPWVMTVPRKWRPLKAKRPQFHGLSWADMGQLANSYRVTAGNEYTVAGAMILDKTSAEQIEVEFPAIWQLMLDQGRAGTEETVLSVLRWKYDWGSDSVESWMSRLTRETPTPD